MRHQASGLLCKLTILVVLSCGPEPEERLDRDAIVEAYCEKLDGCGGELDYVTKEDCMEYYDWQGVDYGARYDDLGCLQEELRYLQCVKELSCDEIPSAGISEDDPCFEESNAVIKAGCPPLG